MSYIPGDYIIVDGQLYHHGIKGQKWYQRRFQNKDGSLTPEGRKRYGSGDFNPIAAYKKKRHDKKVRAQRQAALEKAREAKVEKKNHEEEKQKALRSGDANEVLKFKNELTQQERQEAISRIRWEQDMKNLAPKDVQAGQSRIDKVMKNIDNATTHVNTGIKAWNTFANVVNAVNHDTMLPKIDTNITSGNRDAVKAFKKEQEKASKKSDKFNLKKIYEDRDNQSDEDLSKALKRANTEKAIKKMVDDEEAAAKEAKLKESQKQVDEYNAQLAKQNETPKSEPYSMKGKDVIDSKWESKNKSTIDTGMQYLMVIDDRLKHSDDDLSHAEWKDHKYLDKIKTASGKWRYIYEDTRNSVKDKIEDTKQSITNKVEDTKQQIEDAKVKAVETVKEKATDIVTGRKNMYDVNWTNYDQKIAQIKETQEWKDIVARKDPEYVKTDANGNEVHLIDDYLVKKKHPELDVIDDFANGRKLTINKIETDALVASGKDYINTGLTAMAIASKVLIEKFKFSQGTYAEEINQVATDLNNTIETTKQSVNQATTDGSDLRKAASTVGTVANKAVSSARLVNAISEQDMIATVAAIASTPEGQELIKAGSDYVIDSLRADIDDPYGRRRAQ